MGDAAGSQADDAEPEEPEQHGWLANSQAMIVGSFDIAANKNFDIVLVCGDHLLVRVECVVCATRVELIHVHVHAAVIGPIVCKCDNQANARRLRRSDDTVEARDTVCTCVKTSRCHSARAGSRHRNFELR